MLLSLTAADAELSALCPTELARIIAGMHHAPLRVTLADVDALLASLAEGTTSSDTRQVAALTARGGSPANDGGPRRAAEPFAARSAAASPHTRPTAAQLPPARLPRASGKHVRPPDNALPALTFVPAVRSAQASQQSSVAPTRRDLPPVRAAQAALQTGPAIHLGAPLPQEHTGVRAREATAARDPDAEFDALLADATPPEGVATRDLLGGVQSKARGHAFDGDDADVIAAITGGAAASTLARDDSDIDGDSTEVFDQALLGALQIASAAREVDEFEVMDVELDETTDVPQPPPVPARSSTPEDLTQVEKRPSFLGRLFTRRDGESS